MLQKVKLTKVFSSDTKKDTGQKYVDKNGKPFWRVGIKTDKTGDDWYSALAYSPSDREMQLEEGQEVELLLEEKNGYKNFRLPSKVDLLEKRVEALEKSVGINNNGTDQGEGQEVSLDDFPDDESGDENNDEDIPF